MYLRHETRQNSDLFQVGAKEASGLQQGRPQPLDTGQEGIIGPGHPLSSPLRLDRLAMFHDIVTSPEA